MRTGQRELGVYLDHREAPSGRGDGVAFTGVCLLPHPQFVQFSLEGVSVDDNGQALCVGGAGPGPAEVC